MTCQSCGSMQVYEPTGYARWNGKTGHIAAGDWPDPVGASWGQKFASSRWVETGWCPRPQTDREMFWYHFHHGRLMRYPLVDVLVFAWRHRKNHQNWAARNGKSAS